MMQKLTYNRKRHVALPRLTPFVQNCMLLDVKSLVAA